MAEEFRRRDFLKTAASAAALAIPAAMPAQGATDTPNIGWIGVGTRGYWVLQQMYAGNPNTTKVAALCDTFTDHLNKGVDYVQTKWGNKPDAYADYRRILDRKDIDTVFIATPEHLHYPMFMAAMKAGKHVYVEKPLAHTIEQGAEMVKAWEKAGVVAQVGTQNRSSTLYR